MTARGFDDDIPVGKPEIANAIAASESAEFFP